MQPSAFLLWTQPDTEATADRRVTLDVRYPAVEGVDLSPFKDAVNARPFAGFGAGLAKIVQADTINGQTLIKIHLEQTGWPCGRAMDFDALKMPV